MSGADGAHLQFKANMDGESSVGLKVVCDTKTSPNTTWCSSKAQYNCGHMSSINLYSFGQFTWRAKAAH